MLVKSTPKIDYDKKSDVLYLTLADTSNSFGVEDDNGIVVLKDANSLKITGITVMFYKQLQQRDRLKEKLKREDIPIQAVFSKYV